MTPRIYQAVVIKSAIKLYARTGLRANSSYTPTAMKMTAEAITGKTFKRGDWQSMQDALQEWIDSQAGLLT